MGYCRSTSVVDRILEKELANPRVLAWSVIIKDGQPVHSSNVLQAGVNECITPPSAKRTSPALETGHSYSKRSPLPSPSPSPASLSETPKDDQRQLSSDEHLGGITGDYGKQRYMGSHSTTIKRDFSIWRCLYWPEIALNPVYSAGYGTMRLALCLNKIITSLERSHNNALMTGSSMDEGGDIELLPYIRVYYDRELLFQSNVVNKNACIILEIEVHHPLSKITIEVLDFDNSDSSLVGSSDDLIGHITIPVGAHSNRKPLESRAIIASDENARVLFIRKSHQKRVHSSNLMAQKLLRFPIESCRSSSKANMHKWRHSKDESQHGRGGSVDEDVTPKDSQARTSSIESLDGHFLNELPNSIYFELANQMFQSAIELSHSAEVKYKSTGVLQRPHCSFVAQVFTEIKWSRLSIVPREIFALYLPEPESISDYRYKKGHYISHIKRMSNSNLEINIKAIIHSITLLREIYYSECISPYKEYIWRLLNWESQLHSLFALSILWYLLFNPRYILSLGLLLGLIALFINFDKKNQILDLESSISRRLKDSDSLEFGADDLMEDSILFSQMNIKSNITTRPASSSPINLESPEEKESVEMMDFIILENLLSSSVLSPNAIKYLNKISHLLEKSTMLAFGVVKLHFWKNFLQSTLLTIIYSILFIISLAYSSELSRYIQYLLLVIALIPVG
ncbi:transmembrane domain-containing protein [Cryptosporidium canis]|uniref:Transmembrane domain-containing protein n=1 Tax=Cryptosporidium canis TaxID=195482 RepID=A0ABQ8P6F1_9CRYT|nr:transmembrane domain-containing protein [Cryptosporidium canis]